MILEQRLPPPFLRQLDRHLRVLIGNSTADGKTRPGRKRHASCVFTMSGTAYFGVNLRADTEGCDRCGEWTALGAAFVGGDDRKIVGAVVFSPDYGEGSVACCGRCLNSLGGCIDSAVGDMLIRYLDNARQPRVQLYSNMRNVSYAEAEAAARPCRQ
jgi:cytidine deaminase